MGKSVGWLAVGIVADLALLNALQLPGIWGLLAGSLGGLIVGILCAAAGREREF